MNTTDATVEHDLANKMTILITTKDVDGQWGGHYFFNWDTACHYANSQGMGWKPFYAYIINRHWVVSVPENEIIVRCRGQNHCIRIIDREKANIDVWVLDPLEGDERVPYDEIAVRDY